MHLKDDHIGALFTLIDTWLPEVHGGLTWGRLLDRFKKLHRQAPTERTLRNHTRLKVRFQQKKEQLRTGNIPLSRKPSSLAKAADKIQQLEAKVIALELENQRIFHRLIVWQKNAMDHGLTRSQLERPLPITKDTLHNLQDDV